MENQTLRARVKAARATAMVASDNVTRTALDAVWAEVEKAEKSGKRQSPELDDTEMVTVINRVNKQYTEAKGFVEQAEQQEADSAKKMERKQQYLLIGLYQLTLQEYLPTLMSREEIEAAVAQILEDTGVTDSKQIGRVMGEFNKKFPKKADNNLVKDVITQKLAIQ